MKKSVRVGAILPATYWADEEWKNAEPAFSYVDEAAAKGVELLVFPEGYPGPMTGSLHPGQLPYRMMDRLREKARQHRMFIAAGDVEENPEIEGTFFLTLKLISDKGEILARYVRLQPDVPPLSSYLYNGKTHLLPGKDFAVVDTPLGKIGLQICSELFIPEICRVMMLRGTQILISPIHGAHSKLSFNEPRLKDTWHCTARARAAENLYYVICTQDAYIDQTGKPRVSFGSFVAGPEKMEGVNEIPGLLVVDLDMERLAYLRSRNFDEENLSTSLPEGIEPLGCRPGEIWERNPALYKELAEPHTYSFDYDYYKKGLDEWIRAYDRIYAGDYARIQKKYGKLQFK